MAALGHENFPLSARACVVPWKGKHKIRCDFFSSSGRLLVSQAAVRETKALADAMLAEIKSALRMLGIPEADR